MRKLLLFGLVALGAAVAVAALAQTPKPQPPPVPEKKSERRLEVRVTPEMLRHSRINDALYFADFLYGVGALLLVLGVGWSARMRDIASRAAKKPFLAAMLYFVLLTLALTVIEFPLDFYGGYVVPHQFDLTDQLRRRGWATSARASAVSLVIVIAHRRAGAARHPQSAGAGGSCCGSARSRLILLVVIATPLVIDPLFNKFEPLQDQALKRALLDEAVARRHRGRAASTRSTSRSRRRR